MNTFDDDNGYKIFQLGSWISGTKIVSNNGVPTLLSRDIGRLSGLPFDNKVRDIGGSIVGEMIGGRFEHWPGKPFRW